MTKLKLIAILFLFFGGFLIAAPQATASTGGGGLPWESPLETLRDSLTGPVAYGIAIIGILTCGGVLVFGGQINDFTRTALYIVLGVSIVLGANTLLSVLGFGGPSTIKHTQQPKKIHAPGTNPNI